MSTSFGLTSGLLCHYWYNWLDRALPGRGVRIVLQKIAWDQVLFRQLHFAIQTTLSPVNMSITGQSLVDWMVNVWPAARCVSGAVCWWRAGWRTAPPPAC